MLNTRYLLTGLLILAGGLSYARNPAIDAPFNRTGDPAAHVFSDGKLYVYVTYPNRDGSSTRLHAFTSGDLLAWTDHDLQFGVTDTKWGSGNIVAPDCIEKDGKFYLYYSAQSGNAMHTGVAVGSSPLGPFKEALGKPLLEDAPDPMVFKDDDGNYFLYSRTKVAKLNADLTSLAEPARQISLTGHDNAMPPSAPFMIKNGNRYYWTAAENGNALTYWTGDTPVGPFAYGGRFMDPTGKSNHHSIVSFQHRQLLFYQRVSKQGDGFSPEEGPRVSIEEFRFGGDGSIRKLNSSEKGVEFTQFFPKVKSMKDMWYEDKNYVGYLFIHMTTPDYGRLYYALSKDGLHFGDVNGGKRINEDFSGHSSLTRGHDGRYYLGGNGIWVSSDLVKWERYSQWNPDADKTPNFTPFGNRAGVLKLFYDSKSQMYIITGQTSIFGGMRDPAIIRPFEDERMWGGERAVFALSKDLKTFSDTRLLLPNFDNGQLDIFVTRIGEKYYTVFKDERYPSYEWPTGKTIKVASSDYPTGPWTAPGPSISPNFCEAPSLCPRLDRTGYYMYFERYQGRGYEIATAPTMEGPWYNVYKMEYSFPEDARHGWVHPITQQEWDNIVKAFGEPVYPPPPPMGNGGRGTGTPGGPGTPGGRGGPAGRGGGPPPVQ
jgi:hypothetical protein